MKLDYLLVLALLLPPLAYTAEKVPMNYAQAYLAWEDSKLNPGWLEYTGVEMSHNNEHGIDEKGNCYSKPGEEVRFITVMNSEGVIMDVIANLNSEKSQCFVGSYLGTKFPRPPYAPYYGSWIIK